MALREAGVKRRGTRGFVPWYASFSIVIRSGEEYYSTTWTWGAESQWRYLYGLWILDDARKDLDFGRSACSAAGGSGRDARGVGSRECGLFKATKALECGRGRVQPLARLLLSFNDLLISSIDRC